MARRKKGALDEHTGLPIELLDDLLKQWGGPAKLLGNDGLLRAMTAALVQRAMDAEMAHHLDYEPGQEPPEGQTNRRNGKTPKKLRTGRGDLVVQVPRDREATFEPVMVPKHQRHFDGFDDQILALYARGSSTRDIQAFLQETYGTQVSPDLISRVTDSIEQELNSWRNRPLEAMYPIVYLDALVTKIRDKGSVVNKSIYLAVGVNPDGGKEVLGMWIQTTEGAKFWLAILTELQQRGIQDILVLCADGLTGMPEAVEAAFPKTIFQTCIVHVIRASTRFVPWKDRRNVCAALRGIYTATDVEAARHALDEFEAEHGKRYPMIAPAWRARWTEITPFLAFPPEIRRAIYTTNAIEALNRHIRKSLKTKGSLPTEEAALKLVYLNILTAKRWGKAPPNWQQAKLQLAIHFGERFSS
ncbi:MAG: IS256 family transposase [Halobacteriales archaeon]|nr:IS256 family transposase [Halobacteriales archaeon]